MSNNESFIDEVTEEVRRDRLFALFRRYGWIGVVAIIAIVGWSAWTEYTRARHDAAAQAFGDRIVAAMQIEDADARKAALDEIPAALPEQKAMITFLKAAEPESSGELEGLPGLAGLSPVWQDIAEFKRVVTATDMPPAERRARFEALTAPGAPVRLLAEEQLAIIDAGEGNTEEAIKRLSAISQDTAATPALRRRVAQLIVALGGTPGS